MEPLVVFEILSVVFIAVLAKTQKDKEKRGPLDATKGPLPLKRRLGDPYGRIPENILPPYSRKHFLMGISEEEYLRLEERIKGLLEDGWEVEIAPDGTSFHAVRDENL